MHSYIVAMGLEIIFCQACLKLIFVFATNFIFCQFLLAQADIPATLNFGESWVLKSEETLTQKTEICKTWVSVSSLGNLGRGESLLSSQKFRPILLVAVMVSLSEETTATLDNEFTTQDIYNTIYSGPLKFSPQCQVVFIWAELLSNFDPLTSGVAKMKLIRQHRDYFLLVGHRDGINSPWTQDSIRFKYFVFNNSVHDACAARTHSNKNPVTSSLFTSDCDAALNQGRVRYTAAAGIPWIRLNEGPDPVGSLYNLVSSAALRYNFTYNMRYAQHGGSAGIKRDGRWYGAVGEVFERTADVALGCGITAPRNAIVEGGKPLNTVSRRFFIRAHLPRINWKAVFAVFQNYVWISLGLTLSLLILFHFWLNNYNSLRNQVNLGLESSRPSKLSKVVLATFGILFEQESDERCWVEARTKSLMLLWMLCCLVINSGYRSRLVYSLTFITPAEVPLTHRALVDANYNLYFRYYGGVAYRYAQASEDPVQRAVAQRAILINSSQECILAALLNARAACLDWEPHGSYASFSNATVHYHENIQLILKSEDGAMSNVYVPWIYRKYSPLTATFDEYFGRVFSSGILTNWEEDDIRGIKRAGAKSLHANPSPTNRKILTIFNALNSKSKALTVGSFYGLLILCAFGLLLAFISYIIERTYFLLRHSNINSAFNGISRLWSHCNWCRVSSYFKFYASKLVFRFSEKDVTIN